MEIDVKVNETIQSETKCPSCGSDMVFDPANNVLKCNSCLTETAIEGIDGVIEEIDFNNHVNNGSIQEEIVTVRCGNCGAHVSFDPHIVSDHCPFCDSVLVAKHCEKETIIRPGSILPFRVEKEKACESYRSWIKGLWFAPNRLKKNISQPHSLQGVYVPYWTYDSDTFSKYTGQRGIDYYVTETYTTTVNGKTETRTRQVRKTRWYFADGDFKHFFDDILILGSKSLPKKYADKLSTWNLAELENYNPKYLSGFRTETYQVSLDDGFKEAQAIMDKALREEAKRLIGGDRQILNSLDTKFSDITFKHTLLPIWAMAFTYNKKVYRFLVNGQTGEVQGERPYSGWKIFFTIIFWAAVLTALVLFFSGQQ